MELITGGADGTLETMKVVCHAFLAMLLTGLLSATARGAVSFSRYDVILQRQPFGEIVVPPEPRPAPNRQPPPPQTPPFVKDLKMCAVTENDMGTRVGFLNVKTKPPESHFLYVGETTEDGITVVDADYEKEGALLRKDGQEYWIYMSGNTEAVASAAPSPRAPAAGTTRIRNTSQDAARRISYAERLRKRREALRGTRKTTIEPPKLSGKDLKKHLQEYQMDLIRKGQPALPIPLTPEMDEQLVKEGVLPPLDE